MNKENFFSKCEVYFSIVEDYRNSSYITYPLSYILFMIMCGIICGCKDLEEIVEVLESRIEVIKKYIEIKRIPCVTTFSNILSKINAEYVELCIIGICKNVVNGTLVVDQSKEKIENELNEISKSKYNTSTNMLINASIEELIKTENIRVYIKEEKYSTTKHSLLIKESFSNRLDELKDKYNMSVSKLVNMAIKNAIDELS